jgi:hypothetical protein
MAELLRTVHCGDGVAWLEENELLPTDAVVTSLPDSSEVPALGFGGWRRWFVDTAALVCGRLPDDAVAVFYQTDVKPHRGPRVPAPRARRAADAGRRGLRNP